MGLFLSVTFKDVTAECGLSLANDQACWIDYDQDRWTDLVTGGVIWRNQKGKRFSKTQEGVGSVVAADIDNDGDADLYSFSQSKVFRNDKGVFTDLGITDLPTTVSRGACFVDLDNDAFVDIFVGGFEDWDKGITYPSFILHNEAGKSFKIIWTKAVHRTRGVTACDFDRDGHADVYASNYRLQANDLWQRSGQGEFTNVAGKAGALAASPGFDGGHSIGAAWGDFDNDGEIDLFAGNFAHVDSRGDQPKSRFLRNIGGKFEDKGECGVWYQESYASPAAGDVDNDGRLDLFFTTVYGTASFNKPNFPVLYSNSGGFKFEDVTAGSGLSGLAPTYQAAFADFRNVGCLSLVSGGKLFASTPGNSHWLEIRLEGDGKKVNRSAIGAQVRVKTPDGTLTRQVEAGTGEGNQNDLRLHFGLGDRRDRVDVEVLWPGGKKQSLKRVTVDRMIDVRFR